LAKVYSIDVTAVRIERRGQWRGVRRVARALLRASQESRAQAARRIIYDHRHLLESDASMTGVATPSREAP